MKVDSQRRVSAFVALVATGAMLVSCSAGSDAGTPEDTQTSTGLEEMEPVTFTFSDLATETSGNGKAATAFMDYIEEESGGKITFEPYWSSSFVPIQEALTALGSGSVDVAAMVPSYYPDELPISTWVQRLGGVTTTTFPLNYLEGQGAVFELYESSETLRKEVIDGELAANGVVPLMLTHGNSAEMLCSSPVSSLADAEGKRVRVSGPIWSAEMEALGMTPVSLPINEVYEGLQRGVIDCTSGALNVPFIVNSGMVEVAKNFSGANFGSAVGSSGYFMNLDKWNALPAEAQQIFLDASAALTSDFVESTVVEYPRFVDQMDEAGGKFTDATALNTVLAKQQEDALDALMDDLPANLSKEASAAILADYQALRERWAGIAESVITGDIPTGSTGEDIRESFLNSYDGVDWDAYRESLLAVAQ